MSRCAALSALLLLGVSLAACDEPPRPTAGPGDPPVVPEIARSAPEGRLVLFVGLDGADWELLDAYMREGRMPPTSFRLGVRVSF